MLPYPVGVELVVWKHPVKSTVIGNPADVGIAAVLAM
jgi:hypothetical protein